MTTATTSRSERQSSRFSAPLLQRGLIMMVRAVGILALLALSACGVGVEDSEGEQGSAVGASNAALTPGCLELGLCTEVPAPPLPAGGAATLQVAGTVALPQDPIPWRPGVTPTQRPFGPTTGPDTGVPGR
jgi:hypothetical protein